MVEYNQREQTIINHFKAFQPRRGDSRTKYEQYLQLIPQEQKRYKCWTCHTILENPDLINGKCPVCGELHIKEMCVFDHNGCHHEVTDKIEFCPICGEAVCPTCGDHNVVQISRVTGYLQAVEGWNKGKQQELKDRVRVNLSTSGEMIRAKVSA